MITGSFLYARSPKNKLTQVLKLNIFRNHNHPPSPQKTKKEKGMDLTNERKYDFDPPPQ